MKKKYFTVFLFALWNFGVIWLALVFLGSGNVSRSSFSSYQDLKKLHRVVECYFDSDNLPDEKRVNAVLRGERVEKTEEDLWTYGAGSWIEDLREKVAEQRWLTRRGKLPIFVVDASLPDGFGFYLEGEDGVSLSQGRDADDINSWDEKSIDYYSQQSRRGFFVERAQVAGILTVVSVVLYLFIRRNGNQVPYESNF